MAVQLDRVVPFGRSLDEYIHLFNLTTADLQKKILSVGDGPASFNAEGTRQGYTIQSVDPLYCLTAEQIRDRFYAVIDSIMQQIEATPDDWVWSYHPSLSHLRQNRERVIQLFCDDYELGKTQGRYAIGELPQLQYADQSFDLGLCSHFLFLYSDHFDQTFHLNSILEMLRVCTEVRIFPLLTLSLQPSPYVEAIVAQLQAQGYTCTRETADYELQRGGNVMLKITKN
jgi:hypothetical protein